MLVYAGIDEAGYGPLLGPLCVAATVFVLHDQDPAEGPPGLWKQLSGAVCRKASDRKRRIAVNDSKKLKAPNDGPGHPLRHLERGVLSFLPGGLPETEADLLERVSARVPQRPWFAEPTNLPVAHTTDALRIAAGRVDRAMRRASIECAAIHCSAIDAGTFNHGIETLGNKAEVNLRAAMKLIDRIWRTHADTHPRIIVDRHGGRTRYAEALAEGLSNAEVEVVAETETISRYTVRRGEAAMTISFALAGDERFLPASLASMTAKYVRELLMGRINRFFRQHLPELKATAGYYGDARRYLTEIKPVMRRLELTPAHLIRTV